MNLYTPGKYTHTLEIYMYACALNTYTHQPHISMHALDTDM